MSAATRGRVLGAARGWIGTPYRHQASRRGVGCDCLGLVRGVWREVYGEEPEAPSAYTPDWAEAGREDTLIDAARRHFHEIEAGEALPGDLLVFRWRADRLAKHCGILEEGGRLIHAYSGAAALSSPLTPSWQRRVAGTFRFPDIIEG